MFAIALTTADVGVVAKTLDKENALRFTVCVSAVMIATSSPAQDTTAAANFVPPMSTARIPEVVAMSLTVSSV
jgi:hypothetical protein